jgi:hypothetical protein
MEHKQIFDNSANIIKYGFEYVEPKQSSVTIQEILNNTSEGLIVYDTKNMIINALVSQGSTFLNDASKKFIALVDVKTLKDLSNRGVRSGFIRSTQAESNVAIIISDKETVYLAVDEKHIFKADSDAARECFDYVNHVIWSKTDFEVIQGSEPSLVKTLRLSVIRPDFAKVKSMDELKSINIVQATDDFPASEVILHAPKDLQKKSHVILKSLKSLVIDDQAMYVNAFDNLYIPCSKTDSVFTAHSLENVPLETLLEKRVWIDGKEREILQKKDIKKNEYLPLDEYESSKPDFTKYYDKETDDFVCQVTVTINVEPMSVKNDFMKSPRYAERDRIQSSIAKQIGDLRKLISDNDGEKNHIKQLNKIENERDLPEKVILFNRFIDDIKLGDDALLNQKSNQYKQIKISSKDILTPNELIGTLYVFKGQQYLAVKSHERIAEAKKWLKEHGESATLALDNE